MIYIKDKDDLILHARSYSVKLFRIGKYKKKQAGRDEWGFEITITEDPSFVCREEPGLTLFDVMDHASSRIIAYFAMSTMKEFNKQKAQIKIIL